jgi:hypothetical protein
MWLKFLDSLATIGGKMFMLFLMFGSLFSVWVAQPTDFTKDLVMLSSGALLMYLRGDTPKPPTTPV